MSKITPIFHNSYSIIFCHLYFCTYQKTKGGPLHLGMSSFPRSEDVIPSLDDEKELSVCLSHIENFDAPALQDYEAQSAPVKGCTVKSYMCIANSSFVVSEAIKRGKLVGWWLTFLDGLNNPECCIPLHRVGASEDEIEAWSAICEKADMKLRNN